MYFSKWHEKTRLKRETKKREEKRISKTRIGRFIFKGTDCINFDGLIHRSHTQKPSTSYRQSWWLEIYTAFDIWNLMGWYGFWNYPRHFPSRQPDPMTWMLLLFWGNTLLMYYGAGTLDRPTHQQIGHPHPTRHAGCNHYPSSTRSLENDKRFPKFFIPVFAFSIRSLEGDTRFVNFFNPVCTSLSNLFNLSRLFVSAFIFLSLLTALSSLLPSIIPLKKSPIASENAPPPSK